MKTKNKKGFTLIELLAVIVIIGIIALIAVPLVTNLIKDSKKKSFENSANGLVESAKIYFSSKTEDIEFEGKVFNFGKDKDISGLKFKGRVPIDGEVVVNSDGKIKLYVTDGEYCAFKDFSSNQITITEGNECVDNSETPIIDVAANKVSTNQVALIAQCSYESGNEIKIEKYLFSKDGGKNWDSYVVDGEYKSYYTYSNLKQDDNYEFAAKCITNVGTSAEKGISINLKQIDNIIINVNDDWAREKDVTISYPKGRYTYQYQELNSIDDTIEEEKWVTINDVEEWKKVDSESTHNTFKKTYTENKYIIARVLDTSDNYVTSASTAIQKIDRTPPVCGTWIGNSSWTNKSVTVKVTCDEVQDEANNISGCTSSSYVVQTYSTTTKTADLSYTIKDNAGNTTECSDTVDVYVDTTAPSLDLGIASTTTSTITVPIVTNEDSDSGIKNTTCEYGTSTSYGKTGTVSNNKCTISDVTVGTAYYYKVVTTNEAGISTTKTGSIKRPTAKTLTYTGSAQTLINAGSSSIGTIEYKLGSTGTYSTELPKATDAGTYTVYYRITKDGYDTVTDNISVVISKKADTITLTEKTYTYDGSEKTAMVTTESGVTPKVTYYSNSSCTVAATPKNAGVYYAKVTTDGNTNYNTASKGCTKAVTINKANNVLKINPTNNTYTYPDSKTFEVIENKSNGSLSCITSNLSVATCEVSGNIITVVPGKTAGSATITVKSDSTDNYNATQAAHVAITAKGTIPSVTANGYTGTYDGKAHGITVSTTLAEASITYGTSSCSYDDSTGISSCTSQTSPTKTNAGTYTIYYQISAPGYNTITGSSQIVINKAENPIIVKANTLKYTGSAQSLVTVSGAPGNVCYSTSSQPTNCSSNQLIPKATNGKTYTVYYYASGIDEEGIENYKTKTGSVSVTISAIPDEITITEKTYAYDGNTKSATVTTKSGLTPTITYYSNSSCTTSATPKNAGTYYIKATTVGNENYNASSKGCTKAVVIESIPNTLKISPTNNTYTYPTSGTFEVTENKSGGALSCTSSNTAIATCSISGTTVTVKPGTTEGSATITVKSAATTNYNEGQVAHLAITKPGICSITANGYSGTYDGAAHGITVSSSNCGTIKYGTSSGSYTLTSSPTYTNAGTYTVYYQASGAGYTTSSGSKQVVINKADPPIKVTAKTLTYTGSAQSLVTVSGAQGTVYYSTTTALTSSNYLKDGNTTIPTKINGGTYTVYYYAEPTNNYNAKSGSVSVTIGTIPDEITITEKTYAYDGNTKAATITTKSGLTPTVTYYSNSSCTTSATPKNAGTYYAKATTIGNENYNAASKGCTKAVTINIIPNTLTLSSNAATYTYPTSGTFTVTKNTSGGTLTCTTSDSAVATCSISGTTVTVKPGTTKGQANIKITSAAKGNYDTATVTHVATTEPGLCSITANGYTGTYDGKAHGITVSSSNCGTIKYGTASGTYDKTSSPTYTNAGIYTVYYQVSGAGYTTAAGSKQVIITGDQILNKAKTLVYSRNACKTDGTTYNYMGGCYIKGTPTNNYVWYNGFMWRIMGINSDNTVRMIVDENVTAIPYGASNTAEIYATNEDYIHDWLNEYFLGHLNSTKNIIQSGNYFCSETIGATLTKATVRKTCTSGKEVSAKVGLISYDEYYLAGLSSSYLNIGHYFWTMTPYNTSDAWHVIINGNALNDGVINANGVRPVINVDATSTITEGDGTTSNYYVLAENKTSDKIGTIGNSVTSGEYVKLEGRIYRVVSKDSDGIKLIYDGYYDTNVAYGSDNTFSTTSGIGKTLNGEVLTWLRLDNSDKIKETTWYQGTTMSSGYTYKTPLSEEEGTGISAKVGLIRVGEMLSGQSSTILTNNYTTASSDSNAKTYWTMNKYTSTSRAWIVFTDSFAGNNGVTNARGVRPVIKVDTTLTISKGTGTWNNPYEI